MNITRASFTTQLRTWLLLAGLTALLIGIGALLGGAFLYIFVTFAVLHERRRLLVLRQVRAQREPREARVGAGGAAAPQDRPRAGRARRAADAARVHDPVRPAERVRHRAATRSTRAVAVTQGLMQSLPEDQVRGVLAHEFAHIKNRDILVSSIAAMIAGAISAIGNIFFSTSLFGGRRRRQPARGRSARSR